MKLFMTVILWKSRGVNKMRPLDYMIDDEKRADLYKRINGLVRLAIELEINYVTFMVGGFTPKEMEEILAHIEKQGYFYRYYPHFGTLHLEWGTK